MLAEPTIDRSALLTAIKTSYGVSGELTFIPLGWGSVCYRLGDDYFVKLWVDAESAAGALLRFPVVDQLHAEGFRVPFGDYYEVDIDDRGDSQLIWGEGLNWDSPGSIWYARGK